MSAIVADYPRISLIGSIGAGKTELTRMVASEFESFTPIYERDVEGNPVLEDFTKAPAAVAFQNQIYFLLAAWKTIKYREKVEGPTIQDYSILSCPLFAEAMALHSFMSWADYQLYESLCRLVIESTSGPTLYVYVRAPIESLLKRINSRGRPSEIDTSLEYLETLQSVHDNKLEGWLELRGHPHLTVDTQEDDLMLPAKRSKILGLISDKLSEVDNNH